MRPWQMTKEEYTKSVPEYDEASNWLSPDERTQRMIVRQRMHPWFVKEAIEDGQDVPAHVLEEYNRNKKEI